ncbi:AraC family transcriptional regulator [Rubripirellula reticaptiva]|uniref:Virulence regulon transcriptional activator VirF n=1 Tax=Rubripirellula reticaptiva TaxID=2528013 RepID=A0A5C6F8R6_9BACT|nr:helix-turn-helix domain-containing protein [Rubripirellula reticaptiva]TWU57302.1 Virulence regulon transcriptional activator VirF [Rubripirellula reticaptiva]
METTNFKDRFFRRLDSHEQVFALLDLLPGLSFFVKDRQGRFAALNRRGCEYCGVATEADAIGKTDHDFFPKQRADEYRADDLLVLRSGEPILNRVESAPESAGSPRLVMTSKVPLLDQRKRVIGVAGFSRQVDQIRQPQGTVAAFAEVIEHMHQNYADNLVTAELAVMAGLSQSQFERRFRRAFGASPRQYLMRIRVEHAAEMLLTRSQTVVKVALDCGFYDHAHFSRSFRRIMNATPSEYRFRNRRPSSH